jgi:S-adenosylmethionine:tRNA ribosyltransferase-isomerase
MTNLNDIAAFDYELPKELIAQFPMNPRENAKLMIVKRQNSLRYPSSDKREVVLLDQNDKFQRPSEALCEGGSLRSKNIGSEISHKHVCDLPNYIQPTDVLVVNNSKVFNARLQGMLQNENGVELRRVELFLIRPLLENQWIAIAKPGKAVKIGHTITIAQDFSSRVINKRDDGSIVVDFGEKPSEVIQKSNSYGTIPIPPYIKTIPTHGEYQTAYAKKVGSVAAPTAGFHVTASLLRKLKAKGVTILEITLHVGLGTFMPVKTNDINEHKMHSEWVEVSEGVVDAINTAKKEGRRIVAIGTTTTRALEGIALQNNGTLIPYTGDVNLFIRPGFTFHVIDGLLTNFHLPKSTLLMLVSAFGGYQRLRSAYQEAIKHNYRFFSFGDAMLIV